VEGRGEKRAVRGEEGRKGEEIYFEIEGNESRKEGPILSPSGKSIPSGTLEKGKGFRQKEDLSTIRT